MIKTRSTYLLEVGLDATFNTIIELYVWKGDSGLKPDFPAYTITDKNPALDTTRKINLSNLLNDFIEFVPFSSVSTGLVNNSNSLNIVVDRTVDGITTPILTEVGVKGFYSAIEGVNVGLPTNKILVAGDYMKASKTSSVLIPLNPNGTNVQIISSPNSEINLDLTVATSTDTADYFKSVWVNCSDLTNDNEITITYNGESYLIEVVEECKHEPVDIFFVNKEGQFQSFTFFKERKESSKTDRETYRRAGVTVSNGDHQYIDYNINGRSSFKINSGFVEENQNEVFKQMLYSKKVWQYKNSNFIPLNLKTSSLEYQNTINDKLIKYTIEFEYSYDDINTL